LSLFLLNELATEKNKQVIPGSC